MSQLLNRCLVTGAAGHIGNVLVRELISQGVMVRALDRPEYNKRSLEGLDIDFVLGDILDYQVLRDAIKGCDVVFHIAGKVSVAPGMGDILHEVNVIGTQNVIKVCMETGVRRMVYTGSIHAFFEPPMGTTIDEKTPFDLHQTCGEYGSSKARACTEVLKAGDQGLDTVIVCPTGVVGPYDFEPSRLGQLLLDLARKKLTAYIDGAYDFVDVRDVAIGHVLAAQEGRRGETYILSGECASVPELMEMVRKITGVHAPRIQVPYLLAWLASFVTPLYYKMKSIEPRFTRYSLHTLRSNSCISSQKARSDLGYAPRSLHQAISDAIAWFRTNNKL
jgi:dihydroflavonol-4-reductase